MKVGGDVRMSEIKKRILLVVVIVILLIGLYIIVDCIRLKNSEDMTKPLITLGENKGREETGESYTQYYRIRL